MNESQLYRDITRQLFYLRLQSSRLLRTRGFTLAKTAHTVAKEPVKYTGRAARMLVKNPTRLARIVTGRYNIQSWEKDQRRLRREYAVWIDQVESKAYSVAAQTKAANNLSKKPLVSLVTPVFNPPLDAHQKLIESVLSQTYGHFELLLFNFGDDPAVSKLLEDYAAKDKRVVVKQGLPNEGISRNSNLCLEHVTGEYVGLLDHDDVLMPNALYECVKAANSIDADFVYSDKDKITEEDERFEPFFKPDWSPEMMLGGNYLTHFDLMRTQLVKKLGGWDPKTDGAQDWDIFLRILEVSDKIVHVPKILYSWRTVASSTASGMGVKPYAMAAQRLAVAKHLKVLGVEAEPQHDDTGQLNIQWPENSEPLYFAIHDIEIDTGNVIKIIKSIRKRPMYHSDSTIEVYVVKGTLSKREKKDVTDSGVTLREYVSGSFCSQFSKAVEQSRHKRAVYIRNALSVRQTDKQAEWICQLTGWLSLPEVAMAGGAIFGEAGEIADLGSFFDPDTKQFHKYHFGSSFRSGYNGYTQWIRNYTLVSETVFAFETKLAAAAAKALALGKIRDDEFAKALALVASASGQRAVYDPKAIVFSRAPFEIRLPFSTELDGYLRTKTKLMDGDPYYNPNLNNNYQDPKPLNNNQLELSSFSTKSAGVN